MRDTKKIEAKLVLGKGYLNQIHLNSNYAVATVIIFGTVVYTTDNVGLHAVPLNFEPEIK